MSRKLFIPVCRAVGKSTKIGEPVCSGKCDRDGPVKHCDRCGRLFCIDCYRDCNCRYIEDGRQPGKSVVTVKALQELARKRPRKDRPSHILEALGQENKHE